MSGFGFVFVYDDCEERFRVIGCEAQNVVHRRAHAQKNDGSPLSDRKKMAQ